MADQAHVGISPLFSGHCFFTSTQKRQTVWVEDVHTVLIGYSGEAVRLPTLIQASRRGMRRSTIRRCESEEQISRSVISG